MEFAYRVFVVEVWPTANKKTFNRSLDPIGILREINIVILTAFGGAWFPRRCPANVDAKIILRLYTHTRTYDGYIINRGIVKSCFYDTPSRVRWNFCLFERSSNAANVPGTQFSCPVRSVRAQGA